MKNYMGIGILVITLMAFSGFVSGASVTNVGNSISYHNATSQTLEYWYISTNGPVSTIVFVANMQTKSNGTWKHFCTVQFNNQYKPLPHNMMELITKCYVNGKLSSSDSEVVSQKHTSLFDAEHMLFGVVCNDKAIVS